MPDAVAATEETPLDPLVEQPEGYGLYEVVLAAEMEATAVREYVGKDVVDRAIYLIKGGIEPTEFDGDGIRSYADPDREHSRIVTTDSETASLALEGALDMGDFRRVDDGE